MKEGWEYSTIGKLCKTYSGGTPLKNVKEYYQDGNIPWLRSGEVCQKYIYETEMFITQTGLANSSAKYYPIDTVVVAMYGATAAQVGILKIESTSNQAVCGILPNNKFLPEFLYYFFCYRKEFLASQAQGGAQPNISQVKIKNLEVPVPSLSEQQSIVDYLDSAFAKIDAMKANAEKALNEAQALFQASLKEMLEPKEGWKEKTLGEIAVFSQGIQVDVNLQTEIYSPGKVRFLRIIDVTQGNVPPRYIDDPGERYYLKADEIAMVRYGTVGFVCYGFEGVIANNLFKVSIKDKSKLQSNYLQYFLKSDLFQSHIRKGVGGAALPAIKFGDIKHIMLGIPPLSEQQSIVATLDSLKSKVDRLQENFDKISQECDALKQAILRQVFE